MNRLKKNFSKTKSINACNNKLSAQMENQIKDAYMFYDPHHSGSIPRKCVRSILSNFGYSNMHGHEIQDQISIRFGDKDGFVLAEVLELIHKKWFDGKGRQMQGQQIFRLFDRREKGYVGKAEIKAIFNKYLDVEVSQNDIGEFVESGDLDRDGYLSMTEFLRKIEYQ